MVRSLLTLLTLLVTLIATAAADEASLRVLRTKGLVQLDRYWLTVDEARWRRQYADLSHLSSQFFAARKSFDKKIGEYTALRRRWNRVLKKLEENRLLLADRNLTPLQRQQVSSETGRYEEQKSEMEEQVQKWITGLDEDSEMRLAAIKLVNARNDLAANLLAVRRAIGKPQVDYAKYAQDPEVKAALARLNGRIVLGPVADSGTDIQRELQRLNSQVFRDSVPVYRRAGEVRLSVIVDEREPVTFAFRKETGPTLLPNTVLQRLGIEVDRQAPYRVHREGDRVIRVHPITIPSLRRRRCYER